VLSGEGRVFFWDGKSSTSTAPVFAYVAWFWSQALEFLWGGASSAQRRQLGGEADVKVWAEAHHKLNLFGSCRPQLVSTTTHPFPGAPFQGSSCHPPIRNPWQYFSIEGTPLPPSLPHPYSSH